ncbi:hypothetical protein DRJ72_14400, partial [Enterococcus faecalis]
YILTELMTKEFTRFGVNDVVKLLSRSFFTPSNLTTSLTPKRVNSLVINSVKMYSFRQSKKNTF